VWVDIAVTIGIVILSVLLAGRTLKYVRLICVKPARRETWSELTARLKQGGIPGDESSVCFALVEYWAQFNRREAAFGTDARNRLADVRAIEALLGVSLPRVYVWSREALASAQDRGAALPNDVRAIYSERRFVRMYWLNGLWNFWLLPVGMLAGYVEQGLRGLVPSASAQLSIVASLAIVSLIGVGLLWWLGQLCRADRVLHPADCSLRPARDPAATAFETLVPRDCVVVVRSALRPRPLMRYKPEGRWEFTRDTDMPLLFAESFDARGTAWSGVLEARSKERSS
jgi:hypothetical protein